MSTYYEYVKNILKKLSISYRILQELEDNPGDLEIIKKEIAKINGFFQVLVNKIGISKNESRDFLDLKSKLEFYLNNYSFEKEIETMSALYSDDKSRLKNIRLKIIESLDDKNLMEKVEYILKQV